MTPTPLSSTLTEVYQAIPMDLSRDGPHMPLLSADDHAAAAALDAPYGVATAAADDERIAHGHQLLLTRFKQSSLLLGLLIGFFIQFSTLGANFLVITLWGEEVVSKSPSDIVFFSLAWSFFTSAMAIVILGFLRHLISIMYGTLVNGLYRAGLYTSGQLDAADDLLEEMILHMECRFVVGALIGVCVAWTLTDCLLGMQAQIMYSVITLLIALAWCKMMMQCFTTSGSAKNNAATAIIMIV